MSLRAAIIGSGIGGLSTAIRLKKLGFEVDVFEANDYPGGKVTEFRQDDFRFDAGPSLFTMPELVEDLFQLSGKKVGDYFSYIPMKSVCQYFYEDGTLLRTYSDHEQLRQEVDQKMGEGKGKQVIDYLQKSGKTYELTANVFLKQSLHRFRNYLSKDVLKAIASVHSLNLSKTMHQVNEARFDDDRLTRLFDRYATYNGSHPYLAPGILTLIPHLEFNLGTYFPEGGIHSITESLVRLAADIGVRFHYEAPVSKIEIVDKKVQGIRVEGESLPYEQVTSNMDIVPTYRKLLPDLKPPKQVMNQERSSSAMIFYWGIDASFPDLDLHNIFFTRNYKEEFDSIFRDKTLYHDPTVYIHISSKYNPSDAPDGKENWFVMINVPYNTGEQDWDAFIEEAREAILNKLTEMLRCDIRSLILNESVLEPRTIESRTSSYGGSLYGASSNHWMSAFMRHANFHQKVKGLYFCGGSVHPGGGIPLSILSGKIVHDLVKKDYGL